MKGNVVATPWYGGLLQVIFMFFVVYGVSTGMVIGFSLFGLIGGLVGLLLHRRGIVKFPNYKIAAFTGYIGFILVFLIIPILLFAGSSSFGSEILFIIFIPFIHAAVTVGFLVFMEHKKAFYSMYWGYVAAFFCASLVMAVAFLFLLLFGFSSGFGSFTSFL